MLPNSASSIFSTRQTRLLAGSVALWQDEILRKRGYFIVIDGLGGCGKSTQAKLLANSLGKRALLTHEPGGTSRADAIRRSLLRDKKKGDPLSDFFLFWAARAEHMYQRLVPALRKDRIVVSDRFDSSTFAFQVAGEGRKDLASLFWDVRRAVLAPAEPDLYIILDMSAAGAAARRRAHGKRVDRFDEREYAFQVRVRAGFKAFARTLEQRAYAVDADRSIEDIQADIAHLVEKMLAR